MEAEPLEQNGGTKERFSLDLEFDVDDEQRHC